MLWNTNMSAVRMLETHHSEVEVCAFLPSPSCWNCRLPVSFPWQQILWEIRGVWLYRQQKAAEDCFKISLFKSAKLSNIHIINESSKNLLSPPMKSHPVMLIIKGSDLNCFLYGYGMFLGLFSCRSESDGARLCSTCCCSPEADTLSCFPPVGLSCCTFTLPFQHNCIIVSVPQGQTRKR